MTSYLPLVQSVPIDASVMENVYQSESNMRKSRTPVIQSQTLKQVFPNMAIVGGQQAMDIAQGPLISHLQIVLKISGADLNTLRATNRASFLRQGWGFRALDFVQLLLGGSTQLRFYSRQIFMQALQDCETNEKRQAMLQLAGPEWDSSAARPVGENGTPLDLVAYIPIYLPFSNLSMSKYIPFDTGIMGKPISLLFEFTDVTRLFSYASGDASVIQPALPKNYKDKYMMYMTSLMALGPSESGRF